MSLSVGGLSGGAARSELHLVLFVYLFDDGAVAVGGAVGALAVGASEGNVGACAALLVRAARTGVGAGGVVSRT